MIYQDYIASCENSNIKHLKKIMTSPKNFPHFLVVEGRKHAEVFKKSRYFRLVRWFIGENVQYDFSWIDKRDVTIISDRVLKYLSDVEFNQGIIGLFSATYSLFDSAHILEQSTFVLDFIADPGNLGTIIRTAVSLGRKNLIMIDGVFPFSPKVVRASAGMLAHIRIIRMSSVEIQIYLSKNKMSLLKMDMSGEAVHLESIKNFFNYFVLLGNEGEGVRVFFDNYIQKCFSLPMHENAESLNVAVTGAVMGYLLWGNLS